MRLAVSLGAAVRKGGTMRILNPGVRTTAAIGQKPDQQFTPDWDKQPGLMQHRDRLDERLAMGQKMTPPGCGTLIKK
jgi:hypothetical protein